MSLLHSLPGLVHGAMSETLFQSATLRKPSLNTQNTRGHFTITNGSNVAVRALVTDFTAFQRAAATIPSDRRKILVLRHGLSVEIATGDEIVMDGRTWQVEEVTTDPANATYEVRVR